MVEDLENQADGLIRLKTNKQEHCTKTVILTAGNGAFHPRKIELEYPEMFERCNFHYFINDLESFRDKKVMVCGGGDSAVDLALMLEPIAKEGTTGVIEIDNLIVNYGYVSSLGSMKNCGLHI